MDQFKFSLGPFELFASIIGGMPLFLAAYIWYQPIQDLPDLAHSIQENASLSNAFVVLFVSYILSTTFRSLTWKCFAYLARRLKRSHRYFGELIVSKRGQLGAIAERIQIEGIHSSALSFEDRLVYLLEEKIGIPEKTYWIDTRIEAYLREHNKRDTLNTVELHLATHIMYRTWSFGFCVLGLILLINPFRAGQHSFAVWLLPLLSFLFAYLNFSMALNFKRWHNRELLLGFYFAAMNQPSPGTPLKMT